MENSLFYNHIEENIYNKEAVNKIIDYVKENPKEQIYLLSAPLGDKYSYEYESKALVILSPKHKLIFLDLVGNEDDFLEYYEDFTEDLSSISDKYNYKEHIGRPRVWKNNNTYRTVYDSNFNVHKLFEEVTLSKSQRRINELLISLLIGSINDIEKVGANEPDSVLEKVKKNIILFDGEQTRFIYKKFPDKKVSIQGLSGTGKTELLLHKLKEIYSSEEKSTIFFTCHNKALANTLKKRIPEFFNFMKVEKQIEWNTRLWVDRAWGSSRNKDSGLYSYLCHFYNVPFLRYSATNNYEKIFTQILDHVNTIGENEFEYAFDYILIDERQDFPNVLFDLCDKVARKKVYIAGDIFQDIFENTRNIELKVNIVLNRCYRTDPRTLMFAHAVGMGLFEEKKLNWFEDEYWEAIGYNMTRHGSREVHLSREPIRRFEDLELEKRESVIIENTTNRQNVLSILKRIKKENETVEPNDIAIIILDDNRFIYDYMDALSYDITNMFGWEVNRAYESKIKSDDKVFLTNSNNVKGLEFPFVICITSSLNKSTYRYRNILYTMLTRSFIQSYLLVQDKEGLKTFRNGLNIINKERLIKSIEPTKDEKEDIKNTLVKIQEETNLSLQDYLNQIFDDLEIKHSSRKKLENLVLQTDFDVFDEVKIIKFIQSVKEFYI